LIRLATTINEITGDKMLITKDVVSEGSGEQFRFYPYDRPRFGFEFDFAVIDFVKTRAKGLKAPETYFTATVPAVASGVCITPNYEKIPELVQEAVNLLASKWGVDPAFTSIPADLKGWAVLLAMADALYPTWIGPELKQGVSKTPEQLKADWEAKFTKDYSKAFGKAPSADKIAAVWAAMQDDDE
jgi:hypothetical protein